VSDYLEIASDMRAHFLATGRFYESPVPSCDVVPVEAAAKASMAARGSQAEDTVGSAGRERAERAGGARWSGLPSVVSWVQQVREECCVHLPLTPGAARVRSEAWG
jgi:hypothetical protein